MTASDATELGDYARRTKQLISLIDDIRALGGQGFVDLPRIAVIGNQSAGKSSLIEAISGITVPRAIGTCTRCPMECRLQQQDGITWNAQVYLRMETDADGNRLREIKERPFGGPLTSTEELEKMIRRAQLAILNPNVPFERFVGLTVDATGEHDGSIDHSKQLAFSSNVVCVTVWGPDVPDLSFIDLPGIIQNEVEQGSMQAVKGMVEKHIQGNCLILLAISMRDDIENQNAAFLARQVDPHGERTVGVLTKPDLIQAGEEKGWRDILEGRKHHLREGYFITKQPAPKDIEDGITHQAAREAERLFFDSHPIWTSCSTSAIARMGTMRLGQTLSRLLSRLIDQKLPSLRKDVQEQQTRTKEELYKLPEKLSQPPPVKLLQLITAFTKELDSLVQGDQYHRELHQSANPAFETFRASVRKTAPHLIPKTRSECGVAAGVSAKVRKNTPAPASRSLRKQSSSDEDSRSTSSDEEYESEDSDGDIEVSKLRKVRVTNAPIYLDDIRETVKSHVTKELPFNVPFTAKLDVISLSFKDWPRMAENCADTVVRASTVLALRMADGVFGTFQYGHLDRAVRAITEEKIRELATELKDRLDWLIRMERRPYTQNLHYFSAYRDKYLSRFKFERTASSETAEDDGQYLEEAMRNLRALGFPIKSPQDLERLRGPDSYEEELIVAAEVRAYFQVAYKRIIDNVPRIVDDMLTHQLGPAIETALHAKFFSDEGMAARYLAEDPEMSSRRDDLVAKCDRLTQIALKLDFSITQA